jgi:CrcB protein
MHRAATVNESAARGGDVIGRWLAIACGGAAGALLRYWVAAGVQRWSGHGFPYGTLAVNASGSLLMGLLYVFLIERADLGLQYRALLLVGLLGAFTTFSSFSIETLQLLEAGEVAAAVANVLLSVTLCLALCWCGLMLGRQI